MLFSILPSLSTSTELSKNKGISLARCNRHWIEELIYVKNANKIKLNNI